MRMPLFLINLFFVLILLSFSACNELYEFSITQSGNDILFTVKDIDTKKNQLMLYDIAVAKNKCKDSSCTVWYLVRHMDKTDVMPENIVGVTIKYGQEFTNMEVRQLAKALTNGEYRIGATFGIVHNNKLVDSKLVSGSFKILTDRTGNIKLVR